MKKKCLLIEKYKHKYSREYTRAVTRKTTKNRVNTCAFHDASICKITMILHSSIYIIAFMKGNKMLARGIICRFDFMLT